MQTYIDELNNYFKKKDSFYNLCNYMNRRRTVIPARKPSDIIVDLNNLNYNFTQSDFDNFLVNATYRKKDSYITQKPQFDTINWEKAVKIMFTKFTPNNKQLEHLLSCYKPTTYGNTYEFVWVDALIAKGHNFTDLIFVSLLL